MKDDTVNSIEFNRYFKTANSGKSPEDHPDYNKFLADAEKIKLQQINKLRYYERNIIIGFNGYMLFLFG